MVIYKSKFVKRFRSRSK